MECKHNWPYNLLHKQRRETKCHPTEVFMKAVLLSLIASVLVSQNAMADLAVDPNTSIGEVATVLSHAKTAPCLAKLRKIEREGYSTSIGDYGIYKEETKKDVVTSLTWDIIEGGDMVVGSATIRVTQVWGEQFGFPDSKILYVQSCSFEKNMLVELN